MNDILVQGQRGHTITIYHTRDSLIDSKRWNKLVCDIPIEKVAKASILPVQTWSSHQCAQVIDWAAERTPVEPLPDVIADYMNVIQNQ